MKITPYSYPPMTRTIIRSDINETENIVDSGELFDSVIKVLPYSTLDMIRYNSVNDFIKAFYNYRDYLTYNSRLIVIYAKVTSYDIIKEYKGSPGRYTISYKPITDDYMRSVLKVPKIDETWYCNNSTTVSRCHPVAALLTLKNDEITPFDISQLNDMTKLIYGYKTHDIGYNFTIRIFNIGIPLFKIDYLYDPKSNIIKLDKNSNTQVPLHLIDFISANKPSIKHFIDESVKFERYSMLLSYINEHLREILSDQCSKEVLDLYDERFKYTRTFTYISKRTFDRDAKLKRKAELEAELKRIESELI